MDRGNSLNLLKVIGNIESILLTVIRPILMMISQKFAEREHIIKEQNYEKNTHKKSLWIHAASLGEFEQAVPIIEHLRQLHDIDITVTFSSPSGYRIRKNYPLADRVLYLPIDSCTNAKHFIDKLSPDCALFIRYELWVNYVRELHKHNIPVLFVNATYPRSVYWHFFPIVLRSILNMFTHIITVAKQESEYFDQLRLDIPVKTGSDTRLDRIASRVDQILQYPVLVQEICPISFNEHDTIIVLGSSWPKDERLFLSQLYAFPHSIRFIIVPHEPDDRTIARLLQQVPNSMPLSEISADDKPQHIIVDSIGKLMVLYSLADAVYIGGGFGVGIHSCAEPAGYGIPLACGPFVHRSPDAIALKKAGALHIVHTNKEAYQWCMKVYEGSMQSAGEAAKEYVDKSKGMTKTLADLIYKEMNL